MPVCAHECGRDEREGSLLLHRKRVHSKRVHRTNLCVVSCTGMLRKVQAAGRTIRMSTQPLVRQPPSREVTPGFGECIHSDLTIICLRLGSRVHSCASHDTKLVLSSSALILRHRATFLAVQQTCAGHGHMHKSPQKLGERKRLNHTK